MQTCYKVILTTLIQTCCNKIVTKLTTQGSNITVISWLYQSCRSNVVKSLIVPSNLLQVVNSMFQNMPQNLGTSINANTTCQQFVNRLVTTCLQVCYNFCVFRCAETILKFTTLLLLTLSFSPFSLAFLNICLSPRSNVALFMRRTHVSIYRWYMYLSTLERPWGNVNKLNTCPKTSCQQTCQFHQVASVKIRLVASCHLKTCYN